MRTDVVIKPFAEDLVVPIFASVSSHWIDVGSGELFMFMTQLMLSFFMVVIALILILVKCIII